MKIFVIALALVVTAPVEAAPDKGWFCLMGWRKSGVAVQSCQRTEEACEADRQRNIAEHDDWDPALKPCFRTEKAAAFTVQNKKLGTDEVIAVPQLEACESLRSEALEEREKGDRVSKCKLQP